MLRTILHIRLLMRRRHRNRRWWIRIRKTRNVRYILWRLVLVYDLLRYAHRCICEILICEGLRGNGCIDCGRNVWYDGCLRRDIRIKFRFLQEKEVGCAYNVIDTGCRQRLLLRLLGLLLLLLLLRLRNEVSGIRIIRGIDWRDWMRQHGLRDNRYRSRDWSSTGNNGKRGNLDWKIWNRYHGFWWNVPVIAIAVLLVDLFLRRLYTRNIGLHHSFDNLYKYKSKDYI